MVAFGQAKVGGPDLGRARVRSDAEHLGIGAGGTPLVGLQDLSSDGLVGIAFRVLADGGDKLHHAGTHETEQALLHLRARKRRHLQDLASREGAIHA